MVTLICNVGGPVFERYWAQLKADAEERWFPGAAQLLQLPVKPGWPHASSLRRLVALEHQDEIRGDYVFMIDADMRIDQPVGEEILSPDGLTVTMHPGFPKGCEGAPDVFTYERDPASRAYVPPAEGKRYYPGCFFGGPRDVFLDLCRVTSEWTTADLANDVYAVWYDESYFNRYLIDNPPALELDDRYCFWDGWPNQERSIIRHLNKTPEEFAGRG